MNFYAYHYDKWANMTKVYNGVIIVVSMNILSTAYVLGQERTGVATGYSGWKQDKRYNIISSVKFLLTKKPKKE